MLAIDTNVLLRIVLDDDPVQARRSREACAKAQDSDERIFLPQVVLQEMFWVLETVKEIPRAEVLRVVDGLLCMPLWEVEEPRRMARALRYYEDHVVDFTDAVLAAISQEKGIDGVLSFDRDMGKLGLPWVKP
jgi:predicted nucleic-acid-binding protein